MSRSVPGTAIRLSGLLAGAAAATAALHRLAADPLTHAADLAAAAWQAGDPGVALAVPLDRLVLTGSAVAVTLCWAWLLLGVGCVLLEAAVDALPHPRLRPPRIGPRWVRTLVLLTLGAVVTGGTTLPAAAETEAAPRPGGTAATPIAGRLTGLPVPDRVTGVGPNRHTPAVAPATPATPGVRAAPVVRVVPGDSLWAITARLLPATATDPAVAGAWRRLARANADVLGPDPDLIFPGTVLRVPDLDHSLRKDRS